MPQLQPEVIGTIEDMATRTVQDFVCLIASVYCSAERERGLDHAPHVEGVRL